MDRRGRARGRAQADRARARPDPFGRGQAVPRPARRARAHRVADAALAARSRKTSCSSCAIPGRRSSSPSPAKTPTHTSSACAAARSRPTASTIVPEHQGEVVERPRDPPRHRARAQRGHRVPACTGEGADPGWHQAVLDWESLDRAAAEDIVDIERDADPDNWPLAGAAAEDDPSLPEAELSPRGDVVVGGHALRPEPAPHRRAPRAARQVRCRSRSISIPTPRSRRPRASSLDARKAGVTRVAVVAREPFIRITAGLLDRDGLRAAREPAPDRLAPAAAPRDRRGRGPRHRRARRLSRCRDDRAVVNYPTQRRATTTRIVIQVFAETI